MSTSQASSVVDHRVYIGGQDLNLRVTLNNKAVVGKSFVEFEKTKEVGPLLNKVASMRMCVGYPDEILVTEAKYLMQNKPALPQEIRKFFQYICVDEGFSGKMNSNNVALNGTMRATSCRYVASDHADICDQCRLLQEPLNFLGLWKVKKIFCPTKIVMDRVLALGPWVERNLSNKVWHLCAAGEQ